MRLGRLFLLTLVAAGCAEQPAIVRRPDGPPIRAVIDSSDASTLYLRGTSGAQIGLGQREVSDIDHPGNERAIAGLAFAAAGFVVALPALFPKSIQPDMPWGVRAISGDIGVAAMIGGLGTFAFNAWAWRESRARAEAFEDDRSAKGLSPPAAPGDPEPIEILPVPVQNPIEPLRLPDGREDEAADNRPPTGFHR